MNGEIFFRHNVINIQSLDTFINIRGRFSHGRKDVYFVRAIGECPDFLKLFAADQIQFLIRSMCDRKLLIEKASRQLDGRNKLFAAKRKTLNLHQELDQMGEKAAALYENLVEGILSQEEYKELQNVRIYRPGSGTRRKNSAKPICRLDASWTGRQSWNSILEN